MMIYAIKLKRSRLTFLKIHFLNIYTHATFCRK